MNSAEIVSCVFASIGTILFFLPFDNQIVQSVCGAISYLISILSPLASGNKSSRPFKVFRLIVSVLCVVAFGVFISRLLSNNENDETVLATIPDVTVSTISEVPSTAVPTTLPPVSTTSPSEVASNGTMKIVGKRMICTANSESAIFEYTFKAEKDKRHRLEFYNSDVNNSFYVTVEDERGEEISSGSSSKGGILLEDLKRDESYTIYVEITHFENSFDFSIEIMEPDN